MIFEPEGETAPLSFREIPGVGKDFLWRPDVGVSHGERIRRVHRSLSIKLYRRASVDDVRVAITDPDRNLDPRKRPIIVTTKNGKKRTGLARNEDNFSLQVQALDGTLHLFSKSELRSIEYQPHSLMPGDYGSKLSRQELDDIVNFVLSVGRTDNKRPARRD